MPPKPLAADRAKAIADDADATVARVRRDLDHLRDLAGQAADAAGGAFGKLVEVAANQLRDAAADFAERAATVLTGRGASPNAHSAGHKVRRERRSDPTADAIDAEVVP